MLYAIFGRDVPASGEMRRKARPEHLARLQALKDAGRLVLAGPHPAIDSPDPGPAGMSGSLIVAEFPSLEAALTWTREDPYARSGIFASVEVLPFMQVFP